MGFLELALHVNGHFTVASFLHGKCLPPYGLYAMFAILDRVVNLDPNAFS